MRLLGGSGADPAAPADTGGPFPHGAATRRALRSARSSEPSLSAPPAAPQGPSQGARPAPERGLPYLGLLRRTTPRSSAPPTNPASGDPAPSLEITQPLLTQASAVSDLLFHAAVPPTAVAGVSVRFLGWGAPGEGAPVSWVRLEGTLPRVVQPPPPPHPPGDRHQQAPRREAWAPQTRSGPARGRRFSRGSGPRRPSEDERPLPPREGTAPARPESVGSGPLPPGL